jgi:pectate lyase
MSIPTKFLSFFAACLFFANVSAQVFCASSPTGYGRNATGGAGGAVVTVGTVAALKSALQASAPAVIIVTQDLNFGANDMISVKVTNKTLLGMPGVKLVQLNDKGILGFSSGSDNMIIRNLIFEGPSAWDMDGNDLLQNTECTNFWVDHCEFYDGMDGNFDNTNRADNVTVSWCKFGYKKPYRYLNQTGDGGGDHRLTNLIGGSGTNAPADGHFSITFQYCYWGDGCADRMPRARNAELHILNCYYNVTINDSCIVDANGTVGTRGRNISPTGISLTGGSNGTTCYIEGVHFKKIGTMAKASVESGNTASMKLVDCIPVSGKSLPANVGTTTTAPTYSYTALPASQVEAAVANADCGAGANLTVDVLGNVSSACAPNSVNEARVQTFEYSINKNILSVSGIEVSNISIFDTGGRKILSTDKNKINVSSLAKGVYPVSVKTKDQKIISKKIAF